MSTEIYYFLGTGNSLHVAKELQKRIPETKLIPIVSLLDKEFIKTNSEIVGFIFPQYASTMPKIVAKFIDKLDLKSAKYIFAVSTRGGTICRSFIDIDKILKKSSRKLNSYFVLTMPSGSKPLVKSFPNNITEERITKLESEMLNRLDSIQRIIINREINREEDTRHISPLHPFLKLILPIIHFLLPIFMKIGKLAESRFNFYYDFKCSGCAICEIICLAKKIKMVDEKPIWQKDVICYGCFACINFCPEQAIQIKSTWYLKSHTDENGRYHHPEISAIDIAAQK